MFTSVDFSVKYLIEKRYDIIGRMFDVFAMNAARKDKSLFCDHIDFLIDRFLKEDFKNVISVLAKFDLTKKHPSYLHEDRILIVYDHHSDKISGTYIKSTGHQIAEIMDELNAANTISM